MREHLDPAKDCFIRTDDAKIVAAGGAVILGMGVAPVVATGSIGLFARIATIFTRAAPAIPAGVSAADAINRGLVRSGGALARLLPAMESEFAAIKPGNAAQALEVVARATAKVGLEPGLSTRLATGAIQLKNVGGVTTTLSPRGMITVQRGTDILLRLIP